MSNGDDVLDNWEEIDEAELTNKLQKFEKVCTTKDESKLEDIKSYSVLIPNCDSDLTASSTTRAVTGVPGTMRLLQRAAQTKISGNGVNVSQQNSAALVAEDGPSPLDDMNSTFQPVLMVLHKDADEYQSANYTQPISTQTVKILRRPTQSTEPRNNGVRPKQPIKTLQQREQEYAEARLRILGSAKNPEDETTANALTATSTQSSISSSASAPIIATTTSPTLTQATTNTINNTHNTSTPRNQPQQQQLQHYATVQNTYNNYYPQQNLYYQKQVQQQQQQQQQQLQHSLSSPGFGNSRLQFSTGGLLPTPSMAPTIVAGNLQQRHQLQQQHYHQQHPQQPQQSWSPVVGGSVSSYTLQRQQQRQQQQHQQQQQLQLQQQLDVLRSPRGPDGSTGFQMRR